jgi:hypothetical protein
MLKEASTREEREAIKAECRKLKYTVKDQEDD